MGYAEVAVNSPVARQRTFSYSIPPSISPNIGIGQAVWVPFGPKVLQGVVCRLSEHPEVEETRDIIGVIDPLPVLSPVQVDLAFWISEFYLSPLFDAVALMLPPGFERNPVTFYRLSPLYERAETIDLTADELQLVDLLKTHGKVAEAVVGKALGKRKAKRMLSQLLEKGLLIKSQELEKVKVRPKEVPYVRLAVEAMVAEREMERLVNRAPRQAALLKAIMLRSQSVPLAEVIKEAGGTSATAAALQDRGLILIEDVHIWRDPLLGRTFVPSSPPPLTTAQEMALDQIRARLISPDDDKDNPRVFLLHGVTGSGKTEVYMRSLAEAVMLGKRGIVLVPEIALTPQTIGRFASRFPGRVAVMHSKMSIGEQFDVWQRIRDGFFDVVIGPRSALFVPQPNLGLIVIDEEHEWTYKQEEQTPRYHVREVALKLAELCGAVVILGSATPDLETYYRARSGQYQLLELPQRITVRGESALPEVELVDMREELKAGNRSIFSRSLSRAIYETLAAGEQTILFLNRRGTFTSVQCRNCGFVMRCHRCDLSMTYHSKEDMLTCHQCGYRKIAPKSCPVCWSRRIRYLGLGTERVEEEVKRAFPQARTLRWDRDVTRGRGSHERILEAFLTHEADILIGTQMIAKGLDLPLVTLVGIVSSDTMLHLPDVRASERTFQLLSQVAGRAGRGSVPGRVIVQTYTPEHYAIAAGATHDYTAFYQQEIKLRKQHGNPPFSRLVSLIHTHINVEACRQGAEKMFQRLFEKRAQEGLKVDLIGPAPMFFSRIRGRYRWQIVIRGSDPTRLLDGLSLPQGWVVNVDPVTLL